MRGLGLFPHPKRNWVALCVRVFNSGFGSLSCAVTITPFADMLCPQLADSKKEGWLTKENQLLGYSVAGSMRGKKIDACLISAPARPE